MYGYLTNEEFLRRLEHIRNTKEHSFDILANEIIQRFESLLTEIDNLNDIIGDREDALNAIHTIAINHA